MTKQEIKLFEDGIIKLVAANKQGVSMKVLVEYMGYIDQFPHSESEITPITDNLIRGNKISKKGELFFPFGL